MLREIGAWTGDAVIASAGLSSFCMQKPSGMADEGRDSAYNWDLYNEQHMKRDKTECSADNR
jgi:hypothetical protein